jgi:chromosome segregation protein
MEILMHLKSLEIQGFKSFPERTLIEFHEGVTAIIGPNGSGKSNVTDAIRWVLGEQSVKTLRGSRMEDIIFTGTQSRKAMSFAEVCMTIDNHDHKLPFDYAEIQISRRLYRSGESEYLLNKTHCRLKDIVSLFMDTGLGRDGYSIVGQGKVDDILSHRSEDRRKIFEEASGIVKYKTRKEEAEKKLFSTDQNLLRINDIIQELSEQAEPLSDQADTARKYLNLRDDLKEIELAYVLEQADQISARLTETLNEKKLYENDLLNQQNLMTEMREDNKCAADELHALDIEIETKREVLNKLNLESNNLAGETALVQEKIIQLKTSIENGRQGIEEAANSLAILNDDLAGRHKKLIALQNQQTIYKRKLEQAENEMLELQKTLSGQENELEEWKVKLDQLLESLYEQKSELGQVKGQLDLITQRIKALELDIRETESDRNRLVFRIDDAGEIIADLVNNIDSLNAEIERQENEFEEQRMVCRKISLQLEDTRQEKRNAEYKLKTLENMEKSHEGYSDAVKTLMKQIGINPDLAAGVKGTLGELLDVEEKYELAVETALGAAVQNIVTADDSVAAKLIDYLKQNRSGRATFLPVNQIKGRSIDQQALKKVSLMKGFLGVASDLVKFSSEIGEIVQSLLGRVLIAENIDFARPMARQSNFAFKIVTLEGDVINPGGSMTGGYFKRNSSGLLGRSREIQRLSESIIELADSIEKLEQKQAAADEALKIFARNLENHKLKLTEAVHQKVKEDSQMLSMKEDLEKIGGRIILLQQELEQLKLQKDETGETSESLTGNIDQLKLQIEELRQNILIREGNNKVEIRKRDDMRETITDFKVSLKSVEESLQAMTEMSERIEQEKESHAMIIEKLTAQNNSSSEEISSLEGRIGRIEASMELNRKEINSVSEQAKLIIMSREELETRQSGYYDQLELAAGRLAAIQNEIVKSESKAARLELQLDEIRNRLWEDYELTINQIQDWRKSGIKIAEAARTISDLKSQIKNLGPVNIAAIESYASLQERYEFMSRQRDDIDAARHKLTAVIAELTEAMKARFVEHFHLINENFRLVFSELFGGGMAELNLEDDQDVLSCGIEIKAQPPGKRLQNLTLLSGGERCLTAIALLFAILKLRPTPFCVLDEVEAALDDANVSRFTDYIRKYADASQFILVTHRKGTMEAADRLYGVTMQERGISRILSMKLADEETA